MELSVRLSVNLNYNNCTMQNAPRPFITDPSFKPSFNIGIDFYYIKLHVLTNPLVIVKDLLYT
jgi:hypothetical protein